MNTHNMPKQYRHLNARYGLSVEQYEMLMNQQNGVCAACGEPPSSGGKGDANRVLFVDHDHATGDIRGLLCQGCNAAVGLTHDNPATLRHLADYLESGAAIHASELVRRRKGDKYRARTHCPNGHEYTPENTYIWAKGGWRMCRACRKIQDQKRTGYQAMKQREYRARDKALRELGNSHVALR